MSPLIEESWSRYIWTCIGNSDEASGSKRENDTDVADTLTSNHLSPSTPLLGTSRRPKLGRSSNIPVTRPAMGAGDRSVSAEAPDAVPENGPPPSVRTRSNGSEGPPFFEPYDQCELSSTKITYNVFALLQKDLETSKNPGRGYVYALSMKQYPGYVKIGRTGVSIEERRKAVESCAGCTLHVFNQNDFYPVPNYERVESLIHEELRNERRKFACPCRKKATGSDLPMHDEWFAISEAKAVEVVDRWRKWMHSGPYTELKLRSAERLKIDYYRGFGSFRWTDFMEFPRWKLLYIWLYNELHRSRPPRPKCSRWDSLCKHWKSNLLFYLTNLSLCYILNTLPLTSIYIGYFVLVNKTIWTIWGGFALLYAA